MEDLPEELMIDIDSRLSLERLPKEVIIDIYSSLPVKTIIHGKLVCKEWENLVSDPSFVDLHLSRSPTGLIIHHKRDRSLRDTDPGILKLVEIEDKADHHHLPHERPLSLDLNLAPVLQNTYHVGSVNGLVCLTLKLDDICICNPVTREYTILPRHHLQKEGLAADLYGFGVSSLTGEYKVVRALQGEILPNSNKPSQASVLQVEVYTLGTGQWRSLGPVPVPYKLNEFFDFNGTFLNNQCHWIVCDVEDSHEKIATFDFDKETFQLLPSPPASGKEHRLPHQSLAILKGCLCKLETYDFELLIWVMKEYGNMNTWHREVVIRREIFTDLEWPSFKPIHLLVGLKDGSILMVFDNKLCVFDPQSETIEDTKMFDPSLMGLAYRPSFLKLRNLELEDRVHMF